MGIYDRDYYRREGPGFLASIANRGQVVKWLIIINVGMFVLQLVMQQPAHADLESRRWVGSSDPIIDMLALDTVKVMHGEVWRLLTGAFLHAGLWHIVFNMLFLFWFGSDVEDLYGPKEFLAFYVAGALLSSLTFVGWQLAQGSMGRAVGASGAVTAVMVLFAMHYPRHTIYVFFVPMPVWFFVLFQVLQDSYIFLGGERTGVAVTAHLGGAAFGFLYYKMQWRMLNLLPTIGTRSQVRARPRLRVYKEEEAASMPMTSSAAAAVDEQLEAKVDAVLEKVARLGQDSLTDNERQILVRASEVYRKRRP